MEYKPGKGMTGKSHSLKSRLLMSQSHTGLKPTKGMTGKRHSLATRLAMSKLFTGLKLSEKTKQKMSEARQGRFYRELAPNWKGGMTLSGEGCLKIHVPGHPHADQNGYMLESHLIAEEALGRLLKPSEIVHHIDENPLNNRNDNRNDNLLICKQDYHMWLHAKMREVGFSLRKNLSPKEVR